MKGTRSYSANESTNGFETLLGCAARSKIQVKENYLKFKIEQLSSNISKDFFLDVILMLEKF